MRVNFDDNDGDDDYDYDDNDDDDNENWKQSLTLLMKQDNSEDGNECRLSWLLHKVKDIAVQ